MVRRAGLLNRATLQSAVWVQIPCLPLYSKTTLSPMVKRKSHFASNEVFQVQVLVGLLKR
jgi:hypothetical protein